MLDEEYINRSLLDSLDAQADAEPISSSSDSDAPIATASSFPNSTSTNSTNSIFPGYLKSPPMTQDTYNNSSQNTTSNPSQSMYNTNNIPTLPSEYSIPSAEYDSLNQHKLNGFGSAPFRSTASFQPFSHLPRRGNPNPPYRDTTNFTAQPFSTPQQDMFMPNHSHVSPQNPQQGPSHPYDSIHHPSRPFDFSLAGSQATSGMVANGQAKPGPFDSYRLGIDTTLSQSHLGKQQNPNTGPPGLRDNQQAQLPHQSQNPPQGFQGAHLGMNGISSHVHGHHGPIGQSQISYGPQLQPVGGGPIPLTNSVSQGNGVGASTGSTGMNHLNGTAHNPQQQQEEISTIFVVGFPDDMQEREFQNMFTFSAGFEAATLKIPNKDLTAYGTPGGIPGVAARAAGLPLHYAGSNDPYNLVTVNQGGVVVDGGRDGLTSSWPAMQLPMQPGQDDGSHFMNGGNMPMQPPRKQIIGFAKFRTRLEALEARDMLQGRRVDIEKGSVLKAEMAKKNLHTKRGPGVGPLTSLMGVGGVGGAGAGVNAADAIAGLNGLGMSSALGGPPGEAAFIQREKELGVMGAMGIAGLSQRRDRLGSSAPGVTLGVNGDLREEDERQASQRAGLTFGPRGARERAEEDERERERKRKEKEAVRLRQNSYAFEAFHSVPHQMVREGANSLLSAENGTVDFGASHPYGAAGGALQGLVSPTDTTFNHAGVGLNGGPVGPWGVLREVSASAALRKQSAPIFSQAAVARAASPSPQLGSSPPSREAAPSPPSGLTSSPSSGSTVPTSVSAPFSPQSNSSSLPAQASSSECLQPTSPTNEPIPQGGVEAAPTLRDQSSISNSSSSSVSGRDEELSRGVGSLAVSTSQGTVSPQLPSPASGASSGTGRNPGDHNPPINTLYVGNLPTSPIPGGGSNFLEEHLRELFSKQRGYRKLCFKQKSNGPMCFVEFEDVSFAAQAMRDLYGDTLNGLIRNGGIRLSYSKNPLGVRTPTGGNTASFQQQQQQPQNNQLPPLGAGHPFFSEAFSQRLGEMDTIRPLRRDTTSSGVTSPTSSSSSYHYTMSSQPPPRFFSTSPPTSGPFGTSTFSPIPANSAAAFPRANPLNPQGFGFFASHLASSTNQGLSSSLLSNTSSSSFSPFGNVISPSLSASTPASSALHSHSAHASSNTMIPDQPSADSNSTITPANIATATS